MSCTHHPGAATTGHCSHCQAALCQRCFSRVVPPLCNPCLIRWLAGLVHELTLGLVNTILFFVLGFFVYFRLIEHDLLDAILFGIVAGCGFWGYAFIGRYWPVPHLEDKPLGARMLALSIYQLVKTFLALAIGIVVGPYRLLKIFMQLKKLKALQRDSSVPNR